MDDDMCVECGMSIEDFEDREVAENICEQCWTEMWETTP